MKKCINAFLYVFHLLDLFVCYFKESIFVQFPFNFVYFCSEYLLFYLLSSRLKWLRYFRVSRKESMSVSDSNGYVPKLQSSTGWRVICPYHSIEINDYSENITDVQLPFSFSEILFRAYLKSFLQQTKSSRSV